ncbi:MAG: peptide deformylase [bacterium]|nr:peptide deformylase [bacterium]
MQKRITVEPEPVLRRHATAVNESEFGTDELKATVQNLSDTLKTTDDGIGIAAPQIGISKRIFIASEEALDIDKRVGSEDKPEKEKSTWEHYIFINPKVLKISSKKDFGPEGCLSIPGTYGEVKRAEKIKVRAYDTNGKPFERGATGLFARLLQHEIDHLEGVLFIDKANKVVTNVTRDDDKA